MATSQCRRKLHWGHVIVFSKFMLIFLDSGIAKSLGVLIPELAERLEASYATVGLICSLPSTLMYIGCFFVSIFLEKTNGRVIGMVGGAISGFSLVISAFTTNTTRIAICFACCGIGSAMTYMPLVVAINDFFPEHFVVMNTISLYGYTAGAIFLPIAIERALVAYDHGGALIILGGISLHAVVCGATIRKAPRRPETVAKETNAGPTERGEGDEGGATHSDGGKLSRRDCETDEHGKAVTEADTRRELGETDSLIGKADASNELGAREKSYTLEASPSESSREEIVLSQHEPLLSNNLKEEKIRDSRLGRAKSILKSLISPFQSIMINETLFLFSLPAHFLAAYGIYAWMLFLVPHTEKLGIPRSRAVFLSAIGGFGGILGRTCFIVGVKHRVDICTILTAATVLCSLTFILDFVGSAYTFRASMALIQGVCFFIIDTIGSAISKETIVNGDNFGPGYGISSFMFGSGALTAGLLTGYLYDITASYTKVFMIIGSILSVLAVHLLITTLLVRRRRNRFQSASVDSP